MSISHCYTPRGAAVTAENKSAAYERCGRRLHRRLLRSRRPLPVTACHRYIEKKEASTSTLANCEVRSRPFPTEQEVGSVVQTASFRNTRPPNESPLFGLGPVSLRYPQEAVFAVSDDRPYRATQRCSETNSLCDKRVTVGWGRGK